MCSWRTQSVVLQALPCLKVDILAIIFRLEWSQHVAPFPINNRVCAFHVAIGDGLPFFNAPTMAGVMRSFQTGCGSDPLDSGCCYWDASAWSCEYCDDFTVTDDT